MRKLFLSASIVLMSCSALIAQDKKSKKDKKKEKAQTEVAPAQLATPVPPTPPANQNADDMAFTAPAHDFGVIPEGPDANFVFTFVNKGKEPIIIQKAQPSCGCTVPSYSGEPVRPGETGKIDVSYHTKGRVGAFNKSITVTSNVGMKVLTISGNVEKAPASSVPENNSMMKTN